MPEITKIFKGANPMGTTCYGEPFFIDKEKSGQDKCAQNEEKLLQKNNTLPPALWVFCNWPFADFLPFIP